MGPCETRRIFSRHCPGAQLTPVSDPKAVEAQIAGVGSLGRDALRAPAELKRAVRRGQAGKSSSDRNQIQFVSHPRITLPAGPVLIASSVGLIWFCGMLF